MGVNLIPNQVKTDIAKKTNVNQQASVQAQKGLKSKVSDWLKPKSDESLFGIKDKKDANKLTFVEKQQNANNSEVEMLKLQKQLQSIENALKPQPLKPKADNAIKAMPPMNIPAKEQTIANASPAIGNHIKDQAIKPMPPVQVPFKGQEKAEKGIDLTKGEEGIKKEFKKEEAKLKANGNFKQEEGNLKLQQAEEKFKKAEQQLKLDLKQAEAKYKRAEEFIKKFINSSANKDNLKWNDMNDYNVKSSSKKGGDDDDEGDKISSKERSYRRSDDDDERSVKSSRRRGGDDDDDDDDDDDGRVRSKQSSYAKWGDDDERSVKSSRRRGGDDDDDDGDDDDGRVKSKQSSYRRGGDDDDDGSRSRSNAYNTNVGTSKSKSKSSSKLNHSIINQVNKQHSMTDKQMQEFLDAKLRAENEARLLAKAELENKALSVSEIIAKAKSGNNGSDKGTEALVAQAVYESKKELIENNKL